jgi:hypothetical protein
VDVFGDEHHFLDDFLLEAKFWERGLQFLVELLNSSCSRAVWFWWASRQRLKWRSTSWSSSRTRLTSLQRADARRGCPLFFQHDAVEPFARRLGQQFFRERDVFLAGETEAVNDFGHSSSAASMRLEISTSCSRVSNGTAPSA